MKNASIIVLLLFPAFLVAQAQTAVSVTDFVSVKNQRHKEVLYYYENNWKLYRDVALDKGFIKSYKLLTTQADSTANFDLILMTEYADSTQFSLSEGRFQQIIKDTRPSGPKLLNEWQPNDFRQNVFFKQGKVLFDSEQNRKKKKR